ncbi:transposase [Streptomyces triticiradicis]|uniref:Transposase n=1 Tax=Streptomyces triticiradicis TaxID=2651189 RepID=A0A7J5DJE1_9ACTN|nr:transposase [Streptomyces triticiradicis]KAB1988819.1 transposase [Streptomyces triticiradicis]
MGSKSNRSRRYTEEFKRDEVALVHSSGKTVTEVARDPELEKMKPELLQMLRREDIYVWERGAIEAYYPELQVNESNNKNDRARSFCERYTTADAIRGLPAFKDSTTCEFDTSFQTFFGTSPLQPEAVEVPQQATARDRKPGPATSPVARGPL